MVQFAPYLNFRGDARSAMSFYRDVFGGQLILNTAGGLGVSVDVDRSEQIMHSELHTPSGLVLMGSDIHAADEGEMEVGNLCTIMISGAEDEVSAAWYRISDGGTVTAPLAAAPWGDLFGSCVDRFGVPWLFNVHQ